MKMSSLMLQRIYDIFLPLFRTKRMSSFIDTLLPNAKSKILDVGGTPYNWKFVNLKSEITLLNLSIPPECSSLPSNFNCVEGDGTDMQYQDNAFDICFSNSVIEHLGTLEKQALFAREIRRIGRKIWVQTPARSFFLEPHWLALFIHYFPVKLQRKLVRNFSIRGWLLRPSQEYIDKFLSELRLLTFKEMKQLFPDCEIKVERFLGMAKAYIAVRK